MIGSQSSTKKLAVAHSVVHNRPYDDGFDFIKAAFNWHVGDVQKEKIFFCSALCAFMYVAWGFLPEYTPWSIIVPKDLSTEKNRAIYLQWENCRLYDEVYVIP